jgi:hypothetical protein
MSTDRDVTRIVRSWLEEGVTALPDRVLDTVLDQLPATPQRRALWPTWRLRQMNTPLRLAVAAVAVVAIAVIGINILPRNGGVAGPGATASPSPTSNPSPTAIPSPSPSGSATVLGAADLGRSLGAGTYQVQAPFGKPFTITLADPWTLKSLAEGDITFSKSTPANGTAWFRVNLIENVFADPCHSASGPISPPVPSTVDGVVTALANMPGFNTTPALDVAVGGFAGKGFDISNSIKTDTAGCSGGQMLPLWTFRGGASSAATNGGARAQMWVLDVGGTPVVIDGGVPVQPPAEGYIEIAIEMGSIADSIKFNP